jgi:hypothetical protein
VVAALAYNRQVGRGDIANEYDDYIIQVKSDTDRHQGVGVRSMLKRTVPGSVEDVTGVDSSEALAEPARP